MSDTTEHDSRKVVLTVADLEVSFRTDEGTVRAVRGIDLEVRRGEVLAVVGESGSGKSVAARAVLGLLPTTATSSGTIRLDGTEIIGTSNTRLRQLRGTAATMIFQEPAAALDPVQRIGSHLIETLRAHERLPHQLARRRAIELLEQVGIPEPERRLRSYPHELSGGQQQRVMIAMAIAQRPSLIIADEPTTALDVTVQASILELLRRLRAETDAGILLISHNMGVVADLADRVAVMRHGELLETGATQPLFANPQHEYTRRLLELTPRMEIRERATAPSAEQDEVSISLDELSISYPGGFRRPPVRAVDGVSFTVRAGEVLALVGESGSGKSTITRAILGLETPSGGSVSVLGCDPNAVRGSARRALRRQIGMIFQSPRTSLNPRMTLGEGIAEPLAIHGVGTRAERTASAGDMLEAVQLPRSFLTRYPHELSGGQRQRASLARALILRPALLIADEPTSALDVSVQAAVLELFRELHEELGFASLFITHDLAVVSDIADRVAVLQRGRLQEIGQTSQVLVEPASAYTRTLIAAAPVPDPVEQAERRQRYARELAAVEV